MVAEGVSFPKACEKAYCEIKNAGASRPLVAARKDMPRRIPKNTKFGALFDRVEEWLGVFWKYNMPFEMLRLQYGLLPSDFTRFVVKARQQHKMIENGAIPEKTLLKFHDKGVWWKLGPKEEDVFEVRAR
jgi:hypothetical protein